MKGSELHVSTGRSVGSWKLSIYIGTRRDAIERGDLETIYVLTQEGRDRGGRTLLTRSTFLRHALQRI